MSDTIPTDETDEQDDVFDFDALIAAFDDDVLPDAGDFLSEHMSGKHNQPKDEYDLEDRISARFGPEQSPATRNKDREQFGKPDDDAIKKFLEPAATASESDIRTIIGKLQGEMRSAVTQGKTHVAGQSLATIDKTILILQKQLRKKMGVESVSSTDTGSMLLEALDADGWRWRVQIIRAGLSQNQNEYPLDVLHRAAPLYNGVPVFPEHDDKTRGFLHKLGAITESSPNANGIEATFEVMRSRPDIRDDMRQMWDVQQRTGRALFGFSHAVTRFRTRPRRPSGRVVESIDAVGSVDLVMSPSAGGGVIAPLSESQDSYVPDPLQEAIMDIETLLARLRAGETISVDEMSALVESLGGAAVADAIKARPATDNPRAGVEGLRQRAEASRTTLAEATGPSDAERRLTEAADAAERRIALSECRVTLTETLAEARLPQKFADAIRADYKDRVFEPDDLDARIARDRGLLAEAVTVTPHGLGNVIVTENEQDKHQKALDGLFENRNIDGVQRFLTLKQAYIGITGDSRFGYMDHAMNRAVMAEAIAYAGDDLLLKESITSSTFGQMLGDSITRRMLKEYSLPDRQTWRLISDVVPVMDFRTQRRPRWGGYGLLSVVGEGGTYQSLTSPGDEEATDKLDKYGGLEDLTIETIANDDVRQVRRIPQKLGQAARDTLYNAVWNTTIVGNATASYDTTALFDAAHANTGTTALGEAGLIAVETAMRNQLEFGNQSTLPLGDSNMPRLIAIPNELRVTAHKLVMGPNALISGEDATTPNMFYGRYQVVVIDSWTDATDWYAFADPSNVATLEVGFYQGREEPELFVQDAQTVGSAFSADKVTYKIRHIWYVMVADHRAAYRMVVA